MSATHQQPPPQPPAWMNSEQRAYFARLLAALPRPWPADPHYLARVAFTAAFPSRPPRLH